MTVQTSDTGLSPEAKRILDAGLAQGVFSLTNPKRWDQVPAASELEAMAQGEKPLPPGLSL